MEKQFAKLGSDVNSKTSNIGDQVTNTTNILSTNMNSKLKDLGEDMFGKVNGV